VTYADEDLNALLDGELGSADAKMLREALANDTALATRLEQLALADSIVKTTYQAIDSEPLPQSVLELLVDEPDEKSNVMVIEPANWRSRHMQVAAAMILGVGVAIGASLLTQTTPDLYAQATTIGPINTQSTLTTILSDSNSAVSHPLSKNNSGNEPVVAVMPVLSFKSSMGDWCREYMVTSYTETARVLACMQDEQWQIVLTSADQVSSRSDDYATASDVTTAGFDTRVDHLIVGDPLSADQESKLIRNNWRK